MITHSSESDAACMAKWWSNPFLRNRQMKWKGIWTAASQFPVCQVLCLSRWNHRTVTTSSFFQQCNLRGNGKGFGGNRFQFSENEGREAYLRPDKEWYTVTWIWTAGRSLSKSGFGSTLAESVRCTDAYIGKLLVDILRDSDFSICKAVKANIS